MSRRPTRVAAWLALLAIFFAQLATAAYACPDIEAALKAPPSAAKMPTPCDQMGMDSAADGAGLCVEHCKVGLQLVDTQPTPDYTAHPPVLVFLVATLVADPSVRSLSLEPLLTRATALPIFASSNRLRI